MSRRLWLPALLLALMLGALVAAFFAERRIEGEVPGEGSIISLAWSDGKLLAVTDQGSFWRDGSGWQDAGITPLPLATGSNLEQVVVVDGSQVSSVKGGEKIVISKVPEGLRPTAVAVDANGRIYLAGVRNENSEVYIDGEKIDAPGPTQPADIIAITVSQEGRIVVGGLRTGVMDLERGAWRRLLATPARALLFDPDDDARLLMGTSGGILQSRDEGMSWTFTEMRLEIESMTASGTAFFAVTADRLIYESNDGDRSWDLESSLSPR